MFKNLIFNIQTSKLTVLYGFHSRVQLISGILKLSNFEVLFFWYRKNLADVVK